MLGTSRLLYSTSSSQCNSLKTTLYFQSSPLFLRKGGGGVGEIENITVIGECTEFRGRALAQLQDPLPPQINSCHLSSQVVGIKNTCTPICLTFWRAMGQMAAVSSSLTQHSELFSVQHRNIIHRSKSNISVPGKDLYFFHIRMTQIFIPLKSTNDNKLF